MIASILVVLTAAAAYGLEAPELVKPFQSTESCLIEASKMNAVYADDLRKAGAVFTCLVITTPTI